MKAKLSKDGWLNLTPETQDEYDILMFMSEKGGVFKTNGYKYFESPSLGNCDFCYTAAAGWTFDESFFEKVIKVFKK